MLQARAAASAATRRPVIGIDLGTTNSCVAIYENGQSVVIPNAEGARTTPSVVSFGGSAPLVGAVAKRQAVLHHDRTLFATKRLIGRKFGDATIHADALPYQVVAGKDGDACVQVDDKVLTPSQVGAAILAKLRDAAVEYTGIRDLRDAVITVPAYFDETQRQATKDAGRLANLNVLRIVNEPTAAALAYGIDKAHTRARIAVYDLGGGTFDISILELTDGVFEVKATNGNSALGGEDVDRAFCDWLASQFDPKKEIQLDAVARQRLREAAETAKQELSTRAETEVNLPFFAQTPSGGAPVHLQVKVTRKDLEAVAEPILRETLEPCRRCLADSGFKKGDIDEVILVGGMTRMPLVKALVAELFAKEPRATQLNPDEAVAIGAAIQGGVMSGALEQDLLLLDVTPLSLGIETMGGVFTKLIERNSTIPCRKSSVFSTAVDNQERVNIRVYQGERLLAAKNKLLAQFELADIPPAARGVPQIRVDFQIDADGLLNVSAKDLATDKSQKIEVKTGGSLAQEEVDAMIAAAAENEAKDRDEVEVLELRARSELLIARARAAQKTTDADMLRKALGDAVSAVEKASGADQLRVAVRLLEQAVAELPPSTSS